MRLIIADDSAEMRAIVRAALRAEFPDAIEVEDGRQLFSALLRANLVSGAAPPPELVLVVDVRMPVYSGLEVLDAWREADHPIPVVVITSFPDDAVRGEVARLGAVLLPKPFSRATLQRVVGAAARRAHQH